jgi:hypothetical protein
MTATWLQEHRLHCAQLYAHLLPCAAALPVCVSAPNGCCVQADMEVVKVVKLARGVYMVPVIFIGNMAV